MKHWNLVSGSSLMSASPRCARARRWETRRGQNSVVATVEGGYIVAGATEISGISDPSHKGMESWIMKVSSGGIVEWEQFLGGSGGDDVVSIQQERKGQGYIIAGTSGSNDGDVSGSHGYSDVWVVKMSVSGTLRWQKCFGGSDNDYVSSMVSTSDGGCAFIGFTGSNDGDVKGHHLALDSWIVKMGNVNDVSDVDKESITLYPTPAREVITVGGVIRPNIKVYNLYGTLLINTTHSNTANISAFSPGVYVVVLIDDNGIPIHRQIIEKL